jgi:hypothetical protein
VNRSKMMFMAALVAIVVACNTDRPTSQQATPVSALSSSLPFAPTGTPYTFKIHLTNGSWLVLSHKYDDFFQFSSTTFYVTAGGLGPYAISRDSIQYDGGQYINFQQVANTYDHINGFVIRNVGPVNSYYAGIQWDSTDASGNPVWEYEDATGHYHYYNQGQLTADGGNFRFDACNVAPTC